MKNYYLAIDIGASSGRHILGCIDDGKIVLEEIYRFPNGAKMRGTHLCWDYVSLFDSIVAGIKKCGELGKIPLSVAIDTWAVDYVLLDESGRLIGDTVAYRDSRTTGITEKVAELISDEELYGKTGIQKMPINTINQLYAHKLESPQQLTSAKSFLMTPDYFNYLLTGVRMSEYTNATTTGLVNAAEKTWDDEILAALGLPRSIFGQLHVPGTPVGHFTEEIQSRVGFDSLVVFAATHDTASAVMSVPSPDDSAVYISSGTWSLMGIENREPETSDMSRLHNFTNEGGYDYRYRYLKNIMGLWIIQSIRHELGDEYSFSQLEALATEEEGFPSVFPANDSRFLAPESMAEAIRSYCRETGQAVPETVGQLIRCAYVSLARCYAETVAELAEVTGRSFTAVNIVGGGSKDGYLNALTAQYTGLPVYAGPSEGTAIGNLLAQMIASGELSSLSDARAAVRRSFEIKKVTP